MPLMHSPTRPPLALVLTDRPYNAELLASIILETGLASLERPAHADSLRFIREMRPELVFVVGDPADDRLLQLTATVARDNGSSVVAMVPRSSGAHEARVLQAGADACLHDNDDAELAVATVQALLRRQAAQQPAGGTPETEPVIELGPVRIDRFRYEVTVNGEPLGLTAHEYQVFLVLANHVDRVLSPREVLEGATGRVYSDDEARETLKVYIQRIRNKLSDCGLPRDTIVNVRGFGYMLQEPAQAATAERDPGSGPGGA